ncbi:MAG: ABC transporter substrate binding protein [Pseudomonadota bacterium]
MVSSLGNIRRQGRARSCLFAFAAIFICLAFEARAASQRVLVLHSYHIAFPATPDYLEAVNETLAPHYHVEHFFLDTKRVEVKTAYERAEMAFAEKRDDAAPDLVIAFDDHALVFADRHRKTLFADAPILFAAVNNYQLVEHMAQKPNTTGVFENLMIDRTVDLARTVHPEPLTKLIALTNGTVSSQAVLDQVRKATAGIDDLTVSEFRLDRHLMSEIRVEMARPRETGTAFIFLAAFVDATGTFRSQREIFKLLTPVSDRPIYALTAPAVEAGAAASFAISFKRQAQIVTQMARRVLSGIPVSQIPSVLESPNVAMANGKAVERHGLQLSAFDMPLQVIAEGQTFFQRHARVIVALAIFLGALALLLILVQISNMRVNRALKVVNRKLSHDAMHDALTGLGNRRFVEHALKHNFAENERVALYHIDLDRFKHINDTLGHDAGDFVLCSVGDVLRDRAGDDGFAARIGGDEFLIVRPFQSRKDAIDLAKEIVHLLAVPLTFRDHTCRFGASVGVSLSTDTAVGGLDLFQKADIALNCAKEDGRNRACLFNEGLGHKLLGERTLANEIAQGLDRGDFIPFFQPQISAKTGELVGIEALARWQHPTRGLLAPATFLPVAESMGLISEIDRCMLLHARDILADWRAEGVTVPRLSVNTSANRLQTDKLTQKLASIDLGGTELCFELLESIFLDDTKDPLMVRIDELREAGVRVEIDDFGTGHASIVSLLRLNPDGFKIARDLTNTIEDDQGMVRLVASIVDMGRSLGMEVVAEGVETTAQAEILAKFGCHTLQGFGICKPADADTVLKFIKNRPLRTAA